MPPWEYFFSGAGPLDVITPPLAKPKPAKAVFRPKRSSIEPMSFSTPDAMPFSVSPRLSAPVIAASMVASMPPMMPSAIVLLMLP